MKKQRSAKRKTYEIKTIYDDPDHELLTAPAKKTRATKDGDLVADFLVYGDDLSWGVSHKENMSAGYIQRSEAHKWTNYLKQYVNSKGFQLIENSFPNRTTAYPDTRCRKCFSPDNFNGDFDFGVFFESHSPLWVLIFLGTNDLKKHIREKNKVTATNIAENVALMGLHAQQMFSGHCHFGQLGRRTLNVAVVVPPVIRLTQQAIDLGFDSKSVEISNELPEAFKQVCERYDFICIHRKFNMKNSKDGVHMTSKACRKLADAIKGSLKPHLPRDVRAPGKWTSFIS